uniref:SRCR domain-containing protein n=1 Tax=Oncorhynchus tshawytscha TaxID=74940 RepID=A0AAZ3SP53_ONCTS
EVFHGGVWGSVCDDQWDESDVEVVCRQLGLGGVARAWGQAYFGAGSGRVWLDEVRCTGNELTLEQCPKAAWGEHNCLHSEDAGASCTPLTGTHTTQGSPVPLSLVHTTQGLLYPSHCSHTSDMNSRLSTHTPYTHCTVSTLTHTPCTVSTLTHTPCTVSTHTHTPYTHTHTHTPYTHTHTHTHTHTSPTQ